MKRVLSLALALCMVLVLCACGGPSGDEPKGSDAPPAASTSGEQDPGGQGVGGTLKVKRNLQKTRKNSTLHKWGGHILCVFTTK